jgi:molybdopterin molybdotransferase
VLAAPVVSLEPVPAFANSAMDGYAVRAADVETVPAKLREVGVVLAGDPPGRLVVGEGEAARIMTGAPVPPGADAVVMVEHTHAEGGWVVIEQAVATGTYIRPAGDDIRAGDEILPAGTYLGPAQLALLEASGAGAVLAHPRPRVAVISTGDELAPAGAPAPPGKVHDSNRPGLLAQLRADGFEAVDLGTVPDDQDALKRALLGAAEDCDAVLTSGGVSMGERDLVKSALEELGTGSSFWLQVAVRPAKPLAFATLGLRAVPAFGLPGNPVSAFVSYELFARPALRYMAGHERPGRPVLRAVCAEALPRHRDGKLHLMRVNLFAGEEGALQVRLAGGQGSHQLRGLAVANALALVPDGNGLRPGDPVDTWVLDIGALAGGVGWLPEATGPDQAGAAT